MFELRSPVELRGRRARFGMNHGWVIVADEQSWIEGRSRDSRLRISIVPVVTRRAYIILGAIEHGKTGKSCGVLAAADGRFQVVIPKRPGDGESCADGCFARR